MRFNVTVCLVLAGFVLAFPSAAQDPEPGRNLGEGLGERLGEGMPGQPGYPEEWPGEEWPQESARPEDGPRERPMLYYEGFGVMDMNRDGFISRDEYEEAFRDMDADGDGTISASEWRDVHGPADLVDAARRLPYQEVRAGKMDGRLLLDQEAGDRLEGRAPGDDERVGQMEGRVPYRADRTRIWEDGRPDGPDSDRLEGRMPYDSGHPSQYDGRVGVLRPRPGPSDRLEGRMPYDNRRSERLDGRMPYDSGHPSQYDGRVRVRPQGAPLTAPGRPGMVIQVHEGEDLGE